MTDNEISGLMRELRELVRDAHGANKDLRQTTREARQERASITRETTDDITRLARELCEREVSAFLKSKAGQSLITSHVHQIVADEMGQAAVDAASNAYDEMADGIRELTAIARKQDERMEQLFRKRLEQVAREIEHELRQRLRETAA